MILYSSVKRHGHLAQLVESLLDVQVVSGSIPLVSTRKETPFALGQKVFLFCEINPCRICEMHFVREIRLRRVKCLRT